jgi:hypothetical protein
MMRSQWDEYIPQTVKGRVTNVQGRLTKVEDAAEPAVLLADEVCVVLKAKDRRIAKGVLRMSEELVKCCPEDSEPTLSRNARVMLITARGVTTKSVLRRSRLFCALVNS